MGGFVFQTYATHEENILGIINLQQKIKYSLLRWASVFTCGIVSAVIWILIEPVGLSLLAPIYIRLTNWPPLYGLLIISILGAVIAWPLGRKRWCGFLGIRYFWSYPPLWVAIVVGLMCIALWNDFVNKQKIVDGVTLKQFPELIVALIVAVFIAKLLCSITYYLRVREVRSNCKTSSRLSANNDEFTQLSNWLNSDDEISDPKADKFSHDIIAKRIASRLDFTNKVHPTIAVVGPLGSGKSTIGNLVSWHLSAHSEIIFVRISLWHFDSVEAAVRGILNLLIQNLGARVNILSLTGLSNNYITAIEKARIPLGGLVRLAQNDQQPDAILSRLSTLTSTIGCRLILWVEDLERFTGAELDSAQANLRDAERLGALRALFHLLDQKSSISAILADTSLQSRFDIEKIVRFVEHIPDLQPEYVLTTINSLREKCLGGWPQKVIDPVSPENREAFIPPSIEEMNMVASISLGIDRKLSNIEALTILVQTPRLLKSSLRLTKEIWEKLPGEIDFDDTLVSSVLRVARPDLFSFLDKHLHHFRTGFSPPGRNSDEQSSTYQAYQSILDLESHTYRKAIEVLVNFLFPKTSTPAILNEVRLQGVAVHKHVDYWHRYLSVPEIGEVLSDQAALRSIQDWQSEKSNDLINRVSDPSKHLQIEHFSSFLHSNELCKLLIEVVERIIDDQGACEPKPESFQGIASVWLMLGYRHPDQLRLLGTLKDLVCRFTPVSLQLVHKLMEYFSVSDDRTRNPLDQDNQQKLIDVLHETLVTNFVPDGATKLLDALRDSEPYSIYWLSWGLKRIRANEKDGKPFVGWPDFSKVMLDSAELDPERALPQLISFVTNDSESPTDPTKRTVEFSEETADRLFDYTRLLEIFASAKTIPSLDDHLNERLQIIIDVSRKQISSGKL